MGWAILRRLLQNYPKHLLVVAVLVGSTVAFGIWWITRSPKAQIEYHAEQVRVEDDSKKRLARAKENINRLILVDNALYDTEDGATLFPNWLEHGMPQQVFWEAAFKTVLARYEKGFVRYGLDGKEKASFAQKHPFALSSDSKWVLFSRDKDIWRADIDWKDLKLVNEKRITSIGQFNDQFFAESVVLGTEKTLVVRNINQLLRVSLDKGEVHPTRIPLNEIAGRRSPDAKSVVGIERGQFYCYDVDVDSLKNIEVGRVILSRYTWLNNDRCLALAGMREIVGYSREKHVLERVAALPIDCTRISAPSPDGRYVFCDSVKGIALVDVEKGAAAKLTGGAGYAWLSKDTFAFSREVPDSDLRGTWLQKAGEGERRVSPEPYLAGPTGGFIMAIPKAERVVFATKAGLWKMKPDGGDAAEFLQLPHPATVALGFAEWKPE